MIPFNPFSALTSKIFGGIAIAALTFGAVQTIRIEGFLWIEGYAAANARLEADIERIKQAQKEAGAKQAQHDREDLAAQITLTRQVEQAHAQNETNLRTAVDAYARSHPVRVCRQTARSAGSGAGETSLPGDPGPSPESPADADMVAVSRADLDAIAAKAMRDSEWQQLGDAWISEGRAIKASELPSPAF